MPKATAMHGNCLACQGTAQEVRAEDQTVVLLALIASGSNPIGSILLDLCSVHREQTLKMVEDVRAAWNAGTD